MELIAAVVTEKLDWKTNVNLDILSWDDRLPVGGVHWHGIWSLGVRLGVNYPMRLTPSWSNIIRPTPSLASVRRRPTQSSSFAYPCTAEPTVKQSCRRSAVINLESSCWTVCQRNCNVTNTTRTGDLHTVNALALHFTNRFCTDTSMTLAMRISSPIP